MARIEIKLPTDLQARFDRVAAESNEIIDKSIKAGAEVAENYIRANLVAVLSPQHKNGELVNALGISSPKTDRNGFRNVKIGFREPRKDQGGKQVTRSGRKRSYTERTNAMIANVLEHGRSNQQARPFLAPAKKACRRPTLAAIERTFNEEVQKA